METMMKILTPTTNLLGHQALTAWYQEIMAMQDQGIPICILMLRIPGEFSSIRAHCDIPKTREKFLARREPCFHHDICLTRRAFPREATLEANAL
jgi:hypothetical protein